jgi:hypothetical protein
VLADLLDGDFLYRTLSEHLLRSGHKGIHGPLLAGVHTALHHDVHQAIVLPKANLLERLQ